MLDMTITAPRTNYWHDLGNAWRQIWPLSPGAHALIFGVNCFVASQLALYIAFALDLDNPGWAMTTVFIISNPLSGSLRAKALYRVVGTILGGAAMIAIVPNLVDSPELATLAIALWVALCLYLSLLDRTPRAYTFALAGYTAALIGFPTVSSPNVVFDVAIARVEEVALGVLCAAFVSGLIFPISVASVLQKKLEAVLGDTRHWMKRTLAGASLPELQLESRKLAASITELAILGSNLRFDTAAERSNTRIVRALDERLVAVMPLLDAVADRVRLLRTLGNLPPNVASAIEKLEEWPDARIGRPDELQSVLLACERAVPELMPNASWQELVTANLASRLKELAESWHDCLELAERLKDRTYAMKLCLPASAKRSKPLHVDPGIAVLTAIVAICAASAFWIATAWPQGSGAVAFTAIICSLFGMLDDPTPQMKRFVSRFVAILPIVGFYVFFILPAITDFWVLTVSLAPLLLPAAILLGIPKYAELGAAVSLSICIQLSLQTNYNADLATFLNTNIALTIGGMLGLVVTQLMRVVGKDESTKRLVRTGLRDLSEVARGTLRTDRTTWASEMLDRAGLLLPRLPSDGSDPESRYAETLNDLRMGVGIIELRTAKRELPDLEERRLDDLLRDFSNRLMARSRGKKDEFSAEFLWKLDEFIAGLLEAPPTRARSASIVAAIGLRRSLFPNAAPYEGPNHTSKVASAVADSDHMAATATRPRALARAGRAG